MNTAPTAKRANRLAGEPSPYLLQHQYNPVDWRPWGEEAFRAAREQDRPVFLSIGYATCHWCHVMERESFEDEALARQLNDHFICIKVDREERPDVDRVYMTFVQATTGQGGWPLTVFLTPDRRPFFGGTYFPPHRRPGLIGLDELLERLHRVWADQRADLENFAAEFFREISRAVAARTVAKERLTPELADAGAAALKSIHDLEHGGFGGAPKFPQPGRPRFLLAHAAARGEAEGIGMVLHTCRRMAAGGIRDHLGGGFARYSTDERWIVPHFEKMLYDNAQLARLYLEASQASGEPACFDVARETIEYVLRDLAHPEGGFYSAEDADSEGREGAFYTWTRREIQALLPSEEFRVAERYWGLTPAGNFSDPHVARPGDGLHVLHEADPVLSPGERTRLDSARRRLFEARARRPRPALDDKILASWNGLMLGALARAAAVLDEPRYRAAAERNLAFLQAHFWDASARALHHRWRNGARDAVQLLADYAFLLDGALDVHQATLDERPLRFATDLAGAMLDRFYDPDRASFRPSQDEGGELIVQLPDDHDGVEPAGGSVAILALFKLAEIAGRDDWRAIAHKSLAAQAGSLRRQPLRWADLWLAVEWALEPPWKLVFSGDPESEAVRALRRVAHRVFQPRLVLARVDGPAGAQLCRGTVCLPPVTTPEELQALLTNK